MIRYESLEHQHPKWIRFYKIAFLLAGTNFILCTLLTLPLLDPRSVVPLYNLLLRISCIFFMLAQIAQYFVEPLSNKQIHRFLTIISMVGYGFFIGCSYEQLGFNSSTLYLIGAFLVCGSTQLKLLWTITQKDQNIRRTFAENKYGFFKHIFVSSSIFLFLIGTVVTSLNIEDEIVANTFISVFDCMSGLLMLGAVFSLFKKIKQNRLTEENRIYSGYTTFEHQAPQILAIGD